MHLQDIDKSFDLISLVEERLGVILCISRNVLMAVTIFFIHSPMENLHAFQQKPNLKKKPLIFYWILSPN
jgi:hypothetical protein